MRNLYIFALFILWSCQPQEGNNTQIARAISFDMEGERADIHETGYIGEVSVVALEDASILGKIHKVIRHEQYLYLMDLDGGTVHEMILRASIPNRYNDCAQNSVTWRSVI